MIRDRSLDIAVTGVSARFPGSSNIDEWWSALTAGSVLTTRYERQMLLDAGVPASLLDDPDYVPVRGHLPGADRFDNTLFRTSPRDAELMDPQHRLMLECVWTALEDAGTGPLDGTLTTAVFASSSGSGYLRSMLARCALDPVTLEDVLHGTEPDFMASRIAYKLGLAGPAMAVQTACSSALVAVHLAVQALLNGDCDQAVVVAAGIGFPQAGHLYVPGGVLSASGNCRPFDENADGTVIGSGVGCVVLRRLADALEDGPDPYGVILGTAVNNDGAAKVGYYAPSATGQEAVIRAALAAADVDGGSVGFLEAHGTGTRVGDPIEWAAASAALERAGGRPGQIAVGAVKANIGHLDAAAGIAALIKALLVVKNGVLPPMAGFTRPNPLLETDGSPLYIPTKVRPWTGSQPRRAGVSAFGIGGTNAHLIIEQAPRPVAIRRIGEGQAKLVALSAADSEALSRSVARLRDHLTGDGPDLADVSFTLAAGRAALPERLAVSGRTSTDVVDHLAKGVRVVRGRSPANGPVAVIFLFPGQGIQYPGMAVPFAEALPGFSAALDRCLDAFDPALAARLRGALLDADLPEQELDATELAQPAVFAVEHAAATALSALGVTPAVLAGHSLGEITAVSVAGVFDLPNAARFVATRGRAMQACPTGAMLALGCGEERAGELATKSGFGLELVAINAPDSCVVAGTIESVDAFRSWLGNRVFSRLLRAPRAFHSVHMEPALPRIAEELARSCLRRPTLPLAENVTGRIIAAGAEIGPDMLVEQARRPVRFADAVAAIAERYPGAIAIEVGPGQTLSVMADAVGLATVTLCPTRTASSAEDILAALGALWTMGQPIDLAALCRRGRRIHLPGYSFAGPRWIAAEAGGPTRLPVELHSMAPDTASGGGPVLSDGVISGDTTIPDAFAVLADLWAELLGQANLTEESDFFELGGDSLLITRLVRRVNQQLRVQVPVRAMLAGRTLGRQTAIVEDLMSATANLTDRTDPNGEC